MGWKFCPSTHLLAFVVTVPTLRLARRPSNLHLTKHVGRVFAHAWVRVDVRMCLDMCYVQARCSCWMASFVILRWALSDTSSAAWQPASLLWDSHACLLRVEIAGELHCWPSLYMGSGDSKSGHCVYTLCICGIRFSLCYPSSPTEYFYGGNNTVFILFLYSSFLNFFLKCLPHGRVCAYACWSQRSMSSVLLSTSSSEGTPKWAWILPWLDWLASPCLHFPSTDIACVWHPT